MPGKMIYYQQLAEAVTRQIAGDPQEWARFLTTAARLYKYPYHEQLLIYAQRPDATACAGYDLWNNTMHRYVRRGSKGIALLSPTAHGVQLRYVFDVADTGRGRDAREPFLWTLDDKNISAVQAALAEEYDENAGAPLAEQLHQAALQVTENYFTEHAQELGDILADASATGYDEDALRKLAAESISYMLASRCGLQPKVPAFTGLAPLAGQPKAIETLGIAVSTGSEQVLRQIERTIRDAVRQRTERTKEHGTDLHAERGLSHSEPDGGGADGDAGQVRTDAPALSGAAQADPVPDHAAERRADGAPAGDRQDGERAAEQPDAGAGEGSGRDGTVESNRPTSMGGPDEQPESPGRGADPDGTGVQLSLFPTEEAQRIIAESVPAAPFAFSYAQTDVDAVLCNVTTQMRIAAVVLFLHGKSAQEVAAQLPDIYAGGLGLRLENHDLSAWFDASGIRLAAGHAARFVNTAQHLAWEDAAVRIQQLLEAGQYATNVELAEAPGRERAQVALSLWYVYGDLQDAAQYFPLLAPLREGGYPERTARLAQAFADVDYVQGVTANYLAFREALREKPELLRFRYHELDRLQQQLETLALPLQEFPSELTVLPSAAHFITEDEINHVMESGSMVEGGAERIRDFFAAHSNTKERAAFLKDEYGMGGYAPAMLGNWQSDESHDSKGMVYEKCF